MVSAEAQGSEKSGARSPSRGPDTSTAAGRPTVESCPNRLAGAATRPKPAASTRDRIFRMRTPSSQRPRRVGARARIADRHRRRCRSPSPPRQQARTEPKKKGSSTYCSTRREGDVHRRRWRSAIRARAPTRRGRRRLGERMRNIRSLVLAAGLGLAAAPAICSAGFDGGSARWPCWYPAPWKETGRRTSRCPGPPPTPLAMSHGSA